MPTPCSFRGEREGRRSTEGGGCFPLSFFPRSVGRSVEGLKSMGASEQAARFPSRGNIKEGGRGIRKLRKRSTTGCGCIWWEREMFTGQRGDELQCKPLNYQLVGQISSECYDLSRGWILVQAVPRSAQLRFILGCSSFYSFSACRSASIFLRVGSRLQLKLAHTYEDVHKLTKRRTALRLSKVPIKVQLVLR